MKRIVDPKISENETRGQKSCYTVCKIYSLPRVQLRTCLYPNTKDENWGRGQTKTTHKVVFCV